jgi:hypothetical protein
MARAPKRVSIRPHADGDGGIGWSATAVRQAADHGEGGRPAGTPVPLVEVRNDAGAIDTPVDIRGHLDPRFTAPCAQSSADGVALTRR